MSHNRDKRILPLVFGLLAILALPARAVIFEEFLFDDVAGTAIENAANNANPGNQLDVDADNAGVVTNGLGQLNASLKSNTQFGTTYVDTATFTTGKYYAVMELTWDFQSVFDPVEPEQVRLNFINADPRSTQNTAEFRIVRETGGITITGTADGTGSTDFASSVLLNGGSLTQSDKFIAVVAADLDIDQYEILYSNDAGTSFLSAGVGDISPDRGIEAMRMALNNDLSNDNVLIDRIYFTDVSPVASVDALTLEVNTTTGAVAIKNDSAISFDIDSYRIESPDPDSDLNFSAWNSLSDRSVDAVDGPDADIIVGNGVGETWDEAAGSDNDVLAESFLLGSSIFGPGRSETLGNAFQPGGAETLVFEYRDSASGAISEGSVEYVTGGFAADIDGDLDVDGADFLRIQRENASLIPSFQAEYGAGNAVATSNAVPEPSSLMLLTVWMAAASLRIRRC